MAVCVLLFTGCPKSSAPAQDEMSDLIKEGTKLVYHVNYYDEEYDFIVNIVSVSNGIEFVWEMTDPMNYTGKITMTQNALENATYQNNYFSNGDTLLLEDQTTVFVSKIVYEAIKGDKSIYIDAGDGDEELYFDSFEDYSVVVNGKEKILKSMFATSDLEGYFWILDNAKFPLLLGMNIGWSIELKEIVVK